MEFRLSVVALVLIPAASFAQKPDCETIRKMVEEDRAKAIEKLESESVTLEKLRNDIRRGKAKLEGRDARKTPREQLQIVADKIKANETKIDEAKKSYPIKHLDLRDLKPGEFGSFGKGDVRDFAINEIIDKATFTAFISGQRMVVTGNTFRYVPSTGTTLYLVNGIDTTGKANGKLARWVGYLYCSGTKKLELQSGAETVFVLEPLDVEACFKKEEPK